MTKVNKERAREEKPMDTAGPIQFQSGGRTPALLEPYRRHLDHLDIPDEAKSALLAAVWQIMGSFVDRAFGDDPVQHLKGAVDGSAPKAALHAPPVLGSEPTSPSLDKTRPAGAFRASAARGRGKERS